MEKNMKDRVQMYDEQRGAWVKYNAVTCAEMQTKKGTDPFRRIEIISLKKSGGEKNDSR